MWGDGYSPELLILAAYDRRLATIVADINLKQREDDAVSTVQIKGLAAALRDLKSFSATTSALAVEVASTLKDGAGTIAQVGSMHKEIRTALAEVKAELGSITNGGPPLEEAAFPAAQALPDAGRFNDPPHG